MIKIPVFIFIAMFLNLEKIFAQDSEDIVTDRPDVTESPFTVPNKSIQIETGFVFSKNEFNSEVLFNDTLVSVLQTEQFVNAPGILARYGLTDKIELRLGAQLTFHKTDYGDSVSSSSTETDIEGIEIAAKFKLLDQDKIIPAMAIIMGSALPPVSTNFFSDFKLQPAIIFCFDNEITEEFGAGYNLGVNFTDWFNTNSSSGIYSLSLAYSVNDVLGIFGEFYGEVPFSQNRALNYFDTGFTVLLKRNLQLDFSGGYGLNSGITEYFINAGISFRLPK